MDQPAYLILGGSGQLARALKQVAPGPVISLHRPELDLQDPLAAGGALRRSLDRLKIEPSAVFNAAAFTAVDLAETESKTAQLINGVAPGVLSRICAERRIPFVHYSTDYVFNGQGETPWEESDPVAPLNAYGKSKLEGEARVRESGGPYLIFRTSWVYDAVGKNFFNTILRLARTRPQLRIVADQWGAPTYAPDLAELSVRALERARQMQPFPSGIYHLSNAGFTTWHEFATEIVIGARARGITFQTRDATGIVPISSADFPMPAPRPNNSRFNLKKFESTFGLSPRPWQDGVRACIALWNPQENPT